MDNKALKICHPTLSPILILIFFGIHLQLVSSVQAKNPKSSIIASHCSLKNNSPFILFNQNRFDSLLLSVDFDKQLSISSDSLVPPPKVKQRVQKVIAGPPINCFFKYDAASSKMQHSHFNNRFDEYNYHRFTTLEHFISRVQIPSNNNFDLRKLDYPVPQINIQYLSSDQSFRPTCASVLPFGGISNTLSIPPNRLNNLNYGPVKVIYSVADKKDYSQYTRVAPGLLSESNGRILVNRSGEPLISGPQKFTTPIRFDHQINSYVRTEVIRQSNFIPNTHFNTNYSNAKPQFNNNIKVPTYNTMPMNTTR